MISIEREISLSSRLTRREFQHVVNFLRNGKNSCVESYLEYDVNDARMRYILSRERSDERGEAAFYKCHYESGEIVEGTGTSLCQGCEVKSLEKTILSLRRLYVYDPKSSFESNADFPRIFHIKTSSEKTPTGDSSELEVNVFSVRKFYSFFDGGIRVAAKQRQSNEIFYSLDIEVEFDAEEDFLFATKYLYDRSNYMLAEWRLRSNDDDEKGCFEFSKCTKVESLLAIFNEIVEDVRLRFRRDENCRPVYEPLPLDITPNKPFFYGQSSDNFHFFKEKWDGVSDVGTVVGDVVTFKDSHVENENLLPKNFLFQFERIKNGTLNVVTEVLEVLDEFASKELMFFECASSPMKTSRSCNVLVQDSALFFIALRAKRIGTLNMFVSEVLRYPPVNSCSELTDGYIAFNGLNYVKFKRTDTIDLLFKEPFIFYSLESSFLNGIMGFRVDSSSFPLRNLEWPTMVELGIDREKKKLHFVQIRRDKFIPDSVEKITNILNKVF